MKKIYKIIIVMFIAAIFISGCKTLEGSNASGNQLAAPKNVKIEISAGRLMSVTWDAVPNAQGYMIITTSAGCGSGNRTIDTKEGTAVATSTGNNAIFDDFRNGAVQIKGNTRIEITLMPEWNIPGDNTSGRNEDAIMATSVTAKVMALGGNVLDREYIDSNYSDEVTFIIKN